VAFVVAMLGEVPDPGTCLQSIWSALRPQGILSVTELPGDPDALTESRCRTTRHASPRQRCAGTGYNRLEVNWKTGRSHLQ